MWGDARQRIQSVASWLGLPVSLPNELFDMPSSPTNWLQVTFSSDTAERIEMGANVWAEDGTIWLGLLIPVGSGIDDALAQLKEFSNAFRIQDTSVEGLFYRGHTVDASAPDDGVYARCTMAVRYWFTDIMIGGPQVPAGAALGGQSAVTSDAVAA